MMIPLMLLGSPQKPQKIDITLQQVLTDLKRDKILNRAKKYIGTRYVYGASPKTTRCFDCSSFVKRVYSPIKKLPRTSREQVKVGKTVSKSHLKPGDLLFFAKRKRITHVGIYVGGGKFIHASSAKRKVTVSSLNKKYYKRHLKKIKRIL